MAKPKIDKNIKIPNEILPELLTASEWRMLKNRWQILNLLEEGLPIRHIAEKVGVGTDTVVRVARLSEKEELKFLQSKNSKKDKIKSQTPWIFGKK